ncbi:hypothetical protein BDZ89DRAFT_1128445 [Hymenopellis radicata]|nr:hypothetical protein BDZ89DRAFT_1128445 [Hymenopellis radicata]
MSMLAVDDTSMLMGLEYPRHTAQAPELGYDARRASLPLPKIRLHSSKASYDEGTILGTPSSHQRLGFKHGDASDRTRRVVCWRRGAICVDMAITLSHGLNSRADSARTAPPKNFPKSNCRRHMRPPPRAGFYICQDLASTTMAPQSMTTPNPRRTTPPSMMDDHTKNHDSTDKHADYEDECEDECANYVDEYAENEDEYTEGDDGPVEDHNNPIEDHNYPAEDGNDLTKDEDTESTGDNGKAILL